MSDKNEVAVFGCILAVIGLPALILVMSALNGWVLTYLWAWFIVSAFHLPPLTLLQAIGVAMVVSHLAIRQSTSKDQRPLHETFISGLVLQSFTLGFGYFIHWLTVR